MVSWGNLARGGSSALSGYQAADSWMAQRNQQQLQAAAAKAYGEAMMKMSQPQPWRVPMSNDYTPPPPAMTMPNFMQAMPKGLDPAAMGMAADRFAPIARNQQMDEYRDSQIRLGQQRASNMDEYRDNQIKLGQERNNQSGQRIDMARERMDALSAQNEITNKFRDRALQLQALGLEQRNPQAAQAFKATQSKFIRANDRVTSLMRMIGDADRNLAMGVNRDIYDARTMELNTALKAAMSELDAVSKEIDQYDVTGQGLPQPSAPQGQPPAAGAQPPAAAPAPQIPPKALEILRSNPGSAPQFEKTFGLPPGGAQKYMQGASLDGGMGADMMMGGSGGDAMQGQGGSFMPPNGWKGPRSQQLYETNLRTNAAAAADPINQRAATGSQQIPLDAPGVYPVGQAPRSIIPPNAAQGASFPDAQQTTKPRGEYIPSLFNERLPIDSAEWTGAPAAASAPRPLADVEKDLLGTVLTEAKTMADVGRQGAGFAAETRRNYNAAAKDVKTSPNPYANMPEQRLLEEQRRLVAQDYAAATPAEKAEIDRKLKLVYKAQIEASKRGARGS